MIEAQSAQSKNGVVAAGSPFAAKAGARILDEGGNAADAAVAAALALTVADPANTSLFGRCHMMVRTADGVLSAIDGASQAPAATPALAGDDDLRSGYGLAAIPGLPRALEKLHRDHGRLSLAALSAPAAELAENGFVPPPHLSAVWRASAAALARNPVTAFAYLSPRGEPPGHFRHPRLAALIRAFGAAGADALMTGDAARRLAASVADGGGYWSAGDLEGYQARDGEVVQGRFRDCRVTTIGRQGWGHTLIELLSILDRMVPFGPVLTAAEAERLLLAILCVYADRPQTVGTLGPKTFGLPYETLVDPEFVGRRAALIAEILAGKAGAGGLSMATGSGLAEDQDTTHLSVIDRDGASVAMTCSIGPHFGARVADPDSGVLLAHSYRMVSDPAPAARDVTEMAPVLVTRHGRLLLALGAAGSERIPGAIAQVIVNVIDRGMGLAEAVAFPRINVKSNQPRLHQDARHIATALRARAYDVALANRSHENHLGIVHAAAIDTDGTAQAVADPAWDGWAIGAD